MSTVDVFITISPGWINVSQNLSTALPKEGGSTTPAETQPQGEAGSAGASADDASGSGGDSDIPSELPFQLQITYTDIDGTKALRVLTQKKPVTRDRNVAEKGLFYEFFVCFVLFLNIFHFIHFIIPFAHTDNESAQHLDLEKKLAQIFLVLLAGVRTLGLWISSPTLYQLSHPVNPYFFIQ